MGVRAFGPVAIVGPDGPVVVSSNREAALLAVLAADVGTVVTRDRLVEELWTDGSGSVASLRVTVNRLRKRYASVAGATSDAIRTEGSGYVLDLEPARVDVARFCELADSGLAAHRSHRPAEVERHYAAAERCWVGEPFTNVMDVPSVRRARRQLGELRAELAHAHGIELLRGGRDDEARPVLERLVEADPYREDAWALLAVALYRQRRQAEALHQLARLRGLLREDLGIMPSGALQGLELSILEQREPEQVGCEFLGPGAASGVAPPGRAAATDDTTSAGPTGGAVEIDARLRAARTLVRAGVTDEALELVGEVEAHGRSAGDLGLLGRALIVRAESAMVDEGDPHALLDEAQRIGRELRDGDLLARIALTRFGAGVPDDKSAALVVLTEPIELLEPSDPRRIDLLCAAAVVVTFIDASPAAQRLVDEAARVDRQVGSRRSRAVLLMAQSLVGAVQGRPIADVETDAVEAYRLALQLEDPQLIVTATQAVLRCRYARGDLAGVEDLLDTLDAAARVAVLPFGNVRVVLCRTMNAIARGELDQVPEGIARARTLGLELRTFAAEPATRSQQILLELELGRAAEVAQVARLLVSGDVPTVWNAVLALCGDEAAAASLRADADGVPDDDARTSFVAIAAEVAARAGDAELGAWCAPRLEELGDLAIVVGLGTAVLGFAAHFAGLARVATGELEAARAHLERASALADSARARLWKAHSDIELADVLGRSGRHDAARCLMRSASNSEMAERSPRIRTRIVELSKHFECRPE